MNQSEKENITQLLKHSLPKVEEEDAQLGRDLWPAMLRRLQQAPATKAWFERDWFNQAWFNQKWFKEKWFSETWFSETWFSETWFSETWFSETWFDWALGAAVVAWLVFFPAAIPLLLYHL